MRNTFKRRYQWRKSYKIAFIFWMLWMLLQISINLLAQQPSIIFTKEAKQPDRSLSEQIKLQLSECRNMLNYPKTVERFYQARTYRLAWVEKDNHSNQVAPAMMILDCVSQFGLNRMDFHPEALIYRQVEVLAEQPGMLSSAERAIFDVLLTDAMITFMNHLHYGKFNIVLTPSKIDRGDAGDMKAEISLSGLMDGKDFYNEICKVQPASNEYDALQRYMNLVRGQYLEDSYEFPEQSVRKMTINMERLRWLSAVQTPNLIINIPAFTAKLKLKNITHQYKVVVGKPSSPTPILESSITHFTVVPEWKVPYKIFINEVLPKAIKSVDYLDNNHYSIYDARGKYIEPTRQKLRAVAMHPQNYFVRQSSGCDNALGKIVFRFANTYDVYLHDTPQPKLFLLPERGISHGCVRIEQVEQLAALILAQDGSASKIPLMRKAVLSYQTKNFLLKTAVPIKLVYLTCEMIDSQLVIYNDIYAQDRGLELAMYGYEKLLASDLRIKSRL